MRLQFLGLPQEERRLYFEQAAQRRGLLPVIVEKDFWVCWLGSIRPGTAGDFQARTAASAFARASSRLRCHARHVLDRPDSRRSNSGYLGGPSGTN